MKSIGGAIAGSRRDVMVFALFAVLLLAAAWIVGVAVGPYEGDPDYIYMLNGLELLTLRPPSYYTHPGTPVEILAALVIALTWVASLVQHGFSNIQDDFLAHPVRFLDWLNAAFVFCNAGALVFFLARVRVASGRLFPAIAGGLSLFLSASAFLAIHRVTPEPLLLAGGLVVAGLLAPLGFVDGPVQETKRFAIGLGAAIGFCLAVKATAAPLLIMILLLRGKESRKMALAACVVSAVVLTLLVAPRYLEMALWYVGLFTHRGGYGYGAAGAPGISELLANAVGLAGAMPEVFVCLGLYSLVIGARWAGKFRIPDNAACLLAFCAIFICVDILLVLKQPNVRYTIPVAPFLCLGNAIMAHCLFRQAPAWSRAGLIAVLAALGLWIGGVRTQHVDAVRQANQKLLDSAAASGCLVAPYYSVNTIRFNLLFGDAWTQNIYRERLARLYPDFIAYEVGDRRFRNFAGLMSTQTALAAFAGQKCVYLVGSPRARFDRFGISTNALSLIGQTGGGSGEAIALYALKPGWEKNAGP